MRTVFIRGHVRLVAATAVFFNALLTPAFQPPEQPTLPNIDKREAVAPRQQGAIADQTKALTELRAQVPQIKVDFDPLIGSPKFVSVAGGLLSGPDGAGKAISPQAGGYDKGEPHRATKAFLKEHSKLFGHGPEVLANARIKREFNTPSSGMKTVVWEQQVDGLPVLDGVLMSHTTSRGELVNLSSQFLPNAEAAADRGNPNRAVLVAAPTISAARALSIAAVNLGQDPGTASARSRGPAAGLDRQEKFTGTFLRGEAEAKLIWVPMNRETLRLCWDITIAVPQRAETFRVLVDAQSGDVLVRRSLTVYLTNSTYRVFTSDSPSPFSPGHPTPLTNQPPVVSRTLVTLPALDTNASPNGWIDDAVNETRGNNVDAHTDRNNDDFPDTPRPVGSPYHVFDFPMDLTTQDPTQYTNAAVVQLFYVCNWMHDKLYQLGFTEAAGNFQVNNFGRGGIGNDAVQADAQDGGGFNNANMYTPPDGSAARMQMYIFTEPSPRRDGDFDIEVVLHEYTHGLSNRRVGNGVGIYQLQTAGMGEGWSDWYALALLSESGDDVNGNYAAGAYVSFNLSFGFLQNYYYGIRRYPYSTDMTKNPLTFKDIDPTQASTHPGIPRSPLFGGGAADEVHNQGEVWCVTLWDVRANLIEKHGWATGNQLILQLVTDGMNLSPANPNFLQARDAIIQADIVANGGANVKELWAAFARRGMGVNATSPNSSTTIGVVENFEVPDDLLIFPSSGFVASGPVGGPFNPSNTVFTLTNIGTSNLTWVAANTSVWLNVSLTGGTLIPGGPSAIVSASLTPVAETLTQGIYNATVRFTNLTSGVALSRKFSLRAVNGTFFDDFEPDIDFIQWDAFSSLVAATNYGGSISGANSLWLGGDDASRFAQSRPVNTLQGGVVDFYLRIANGGGVPWEQADLPDEGIVLEYSVDGGATWIEMGRYNTVTFYSWTHVIAELPVAAQTPNTSFRWRQLLNSGACCDHWAVDDVAVITGPRPPVVITQPSSRIAVIDGTAHFTVVAGGSRPLSYQWFKDGTNRLNDATNETYAIINVQSNHAGLYSVLITNLHGTAMSSNASLTVLSADAVVAVFDDPLYVDTSTTTPYAESDNVQASLANRGFPVVPFTDLIDAAGSYKTILIPEQENRDLASDLTGAERGALSNFVFEGGTLVIHGTYTTASESLINALFGYSVQENNNGGSVFQRSAAAAGTEFADDPVTLLDNNATMVLLPGSLPANAISIYTNFYGSTVVIFEIGSGALVYLGWDWFDAYPLGVQNGNWLPVLESAVLQGPLPPRPPTIVFEPANRATVVGGNATFAVGVSGTSPLYYEWRREGTNIPGANGPTYSIIGAQFPDAGFYSVLVTNAYGSATSRVATLTVLDAGGVVAYYSDFYPGSLGPEAPIAAAGFLPLHVFDITTYNLNDAGILFLDEVDNLNISFPLQSRLNDIRNWVAAGGKVIVHDRSAGYLNPNPFLFGTTGISTFRLETSDLDVVPPGDTTVTDGPFGRIDNSTLDGGTSSAHGYVPRSQLPADAEPIISTGGSLSNIVCFSYPLGLGAVYYSAIPLDYYLDGNGPIGVRTVMREIYAPNMLLYMASYVVCTNCPPTFRVQPLSQSAKTGTNVTFSTVVSGTAPLGFQWRRDGTNLVNGGRITGATNLTLTIANAQESDSGIYTLFVSNAFGTNTSSNATLFVSSLDHFGWFVTTPQITNLPFTVTIQAQDVSNRVVTNFHSAVLLSASKGGGTVSNTILPAPTFAFNSSGNFTLGYTFTPATNLTVTAVRHYFGSKVSIWTDTGVLLASQTVSGSGGFWTETPLTTPVALTAGSRYLVGAYTAGGVYYWRTDGSHSFPHGTIEQSLYASTDGFPINSDSAQWWLVDLRYSVGIATPVPMSPTVSGAFIAGQWTGNVMVPQIASNVVFRADDALGNIGFSIPVNILGLPRMQTERYGNIMLMIWPAGSGNFRLESTPTFSPPAWAPVSPGPIQIGDQLVVPIYMDRSSTFYRLGRSFP
jgi:hypothetical protein